LLLVQVKVDLNKYCIGLLLVQVKVDLNSALEKLSGLERVLGISTSAYVR
jgi:hypothetical protein